MTYIELTTLKLPDKLVSRLELPSDVINQLVSLMGDASRQILHHYNNAEGVMVDRKADKSPITAADHAAHQILDLGLQGMTPSIPVLSEESTAQAIRNRRQWPSCWMVDPLDGTREFIDRTDEFSINVALIVEARPVLGVITLPVSGVSYIGIPGLGAWRCSKKSCQLLAVRDLDTGAAIAVLASARHSEAKVNGVMSALGDIGAGVKRINAGSALKFCRLVDGEADIYPRTSPCYEWDVAAGDAIVTGAGGFVWGVDGKPMLYNQRDTLLVNRFVAGGNSRVDWISKLY